MELVLATSKDGVTLLVIDHGGHFGSGFAAFVFKLGTATTSVLNFKFGRACMVPAVAHLRNVIEFLATVAL